MRGVLLDTNVFIGAAELSDSISDSCKRNCLQRIRQWRAGALRLIIDTEQQSKKSSIIDEYIKQFAPLRARRGFQGSIGEYFLRELIELSSLGAQFEKYPTAFVTITRTGEHEYEEYPNDPELASFDRSDRKWVAAARSYQNAYPTEDSPEIQNATDSDWNEIAEFLLKQYRIVVSNICG